MSSVSTITANNIDSRIIAELLHDSRLFSMQIRGNCMQPVFGNGDEIQVVSAKRIFPGDIVVFTDGTGRPVAHRLLGAGKLNGKKLYMTKADDSKQVDPLIEPHQLLGKVVAVNDNPIEVAYVQRLISSWYFARSLTAKLFNKYFSSVIPNY